MGDQNNVNENTTGWAFAAEVRMLLGTSASRMGKWVQVSALLPAEATVTLGGSRRRLQYMCLLPPSETGLSAVSSRAGLERLRASSVKSMKHGYSCSNSRLQLVTGPQKVIS